MGSDSLKIVRWIPYGGTGDALIVDETGRVHDKDAGSEHTRSGYQIDDGNLKPKPLPRPRAERSP